MLSLPDFLEKQIVIIGPGEEKSLKFKNDNLVVGTNDETKWQVSCHKIFSIFLIGEATLTTTLLRKGMEHGISFVLMTQNLRSYAVIGAETEGNTILRRKQYSWTDTLPMARMLMHNKVENQQKLLKDLRKKETKTKQAISVMTGFLEKIDRAQDEKELMGYEGGASKEFFQAYFADIGWRVRLPRTKYDMTNTLMDIGYTYLFNFTDALLRLYGFDTYLGFYHKEFYQRKSLACDVMEPMRCLVDRQIRKGYNLSQINEKDFTTKNKQYDLRYKKSSAYTKMFAEAIMERKKDIFTYIRSFYMSVMKEEPISFFTL